MSESVTDQRSTDIVVISASIVAAYVQNNSVPQAELPDLIRIVHDQLLHIGAPTPEPAPPAQPAVPVKKSITNDYIICLEDGKKFKSLKRHLATAYDLTPAAYRAKWGLPSNYPMVAPGYAATRSELAKAAGLGQLRKAAAPAAAPKKAPAKKGAPKKAAGRKKAAA